jgi:hypothetical protein
MTEKKKKHSPKVPNLGRHESGCRVCAHPQRQEIENDFISWKSPTKIAKEYKLRDRSTVYRHAHALKLFSKRSYNVRGALERIIERTDDVAVTAAAVVAAITTYAKINAQGRLIERNEMVSVNDLFDRMNSDELEAYARDGELPDWFQVATGRQGSEGGEDA